MRRVRKHGPDVVQALLSILELEGPLLAAGGAQLGTRTVQLPLDLQLQSVKRHYTRTWGQWGERDIGLGYTESSHYTIKQQYWELQEVSL